MESFSVAAVRKKATETKVKVAAVVAASLKGLSKFACICLFSHLSDLQTGHFFDVI